jgi:DNA-binding NarL/FixJ family response regulator
MAQPGGDPRLGRRPYVLVVDDEQDTRALLRALLDAEGLSVVGEAAHGMEAIAAVRALTVDVVLMDERMPRLSGSEATRKIKEQSPCVQVIILSLYEDAAALGRAEDAGAYCYLVKGCTSSLIVEMIVRAWHVKSHLEASSHPIRVPRGEGIRLPTRITR